MQNMNQSFQYQFEQGTQSYQSQKDQTLETTLASNLQQASTGSVFSLTHDGTNLEEEDPTARPTNPNLNINPQLPIRNFEVGSQYMYRKEVYENVLNHLKDHNKAICYSNIWYNITYLGNKYSKNVEETVMKYAPANFLAPKMPDYNFQNTEPSQSRSYQNYDKPYQRR